MITNALILQQNNLQWPTILVPWVTTIDRVIFVGGLFFAIVNSQWSSLHFSMSILTPEVCVGIKSMRQSLRENLITTAGEDVLNCTIITLLRACTSGVK